MQTAKEAILKTLKLLYKNEILNITLNLNFLRKNYRQEGQVGKLTNPNTFISTILASIKKLIYIARVNRPILKSNRNPLRRKAP